MFVAIYVEGTYKNPPLLVDETVLTVSESSVTVNVPAMPVSILTAPPFTALTDCIVVYSIVKSTFPVDAMQIMPPLLFVDWPEVKDDCWPEIKVIVTD